MNDRQRILIGCPHYKVYMTGSYPCNKRGVYRLRPDGQFNLPDARCGQFGGRCRQVFCFLHRLNRRGPRTWYPTEILASPVNLAAASDSQNASDADGYLC